MTTPNDRAPFAAGFMDDYFAEADEHLVTMRGSLLTLESAIGGPFPGAVVEELFRSCHSLKGISAMVDLREAELVAHHMESCLRSIQRGEVKLTAANVEALVTGARMLEAIVAARRSGDALPSIQEVLQQLEQVTRTDRAKADAAAVPAPPADSTTSAAAAPLWTVTFTPSPALVARGVKVDTVRTRLAQIGKVLSVAPRVVPGGGVSFEFEVETADEAQLAAWHDDGIVYQPVASALDAAVVVPGAPSADRARDTGTTSAASFVRVDLARLDELMRLVGDMVVTRARLEDTLERIEAHVPFQQWRALQEHTSRIERQLRDLREGVMRVRLVQVGDIFRRMPYVIRDLARDSGKRVQLELSGQTTEIDKFLIERMMDPVVHLVRNAISHGIETPEQRVAAGKPPEGIIRLSASTAGESVVLEISDDGAGIDVPATAARARSQGIAVPEGIVDARALLDIICASGFSTRDEADRGSGRGVGMAVVRNTVEELGGVLAVEAAPGQGTTFRITLPLTLAITDAIIAHVGEQTFAVPQSAVREVIEVDAGAVRVMERNELMTYRGGTLPMVRLSRLFSIDVAERPRLHAVVVGSGLAAVGLLVDRIAGQREIVVKTITDPLLRVNGISGATELGDGRLVLILDASALSRTFRDRQKAEGMTA